MRLDSSSHTRIGRAAGISDALPFHSCPTVSAHYAQTPAAPIRNCTTLPLGASDAAIACVNVCRPLAQTPAAPTRTAHVLIRSARRSHRLRHRLLALSPDTSSRLPLEPHTLPLGVFDAAIVCATACRPIAQAVFTHQEKAHTGRRTVRYRSHLERPPTTSHSSHRSKNTDCGRNSATFC